MTKFEVILLCQLCNTGKAGYQGYCHECVRAASHRDFIRFSFPEDKQIMNEEEPNAQ